MNKTTSCNTAESSSYDWLRQAVSNFLGSLQHAVRFLKLVRIFFDYF